MTPYPSHLLLPDGTLRPLELAALQARRSAEAPDEREAG